MDFRKYLSYISRPTTLYVGVNIAVSLVGFLRSFAFMRWLGLEELGLISLVQTVMQFIGLFQLGLINGGYRMFSLNKVKEQERVNNLLFSAFAIFLLVFLIIWGTITATSHKVLMDNDILMVAILAGVLTLTNNWLNNTLIGRQKLGEINKINLLSITASVFSLFLVYYIGFWGAVVSITIHPLCYVCLTLLRNKELRPTGFLIDKELIKEILSYGFIPFLSGIFVILNMQVERWSIAAFWGNEALGRFYLVFLYNTLFMLIPTSVQSIFFPQAVRAYDEGNLYNFESVVKKIALVTIGYDVAIMLITIMLFKPMVSLIFPLHTNNVIFVYLVIPGLLAWSFESVTSLVLNSSLRLRILLFASCFGFIVNILGVVLLKVCNVLSLEAMACLKSLVLIVPFVISLVYVFFNWSDIKNGYKK